jgi:hypothetical protein
MGKQNPYCAARLGKEAKKTETDRRGGQTPKWDQELRFTVHDSPDYHNLKISVFSEDKRTDLIGEAWVSLTDVVVPGGGRNDLWQGLNCKGKYAGEVRIELTYYDTRPKPDKSEEDVPMRQSVGSGGKVKRRPLPTAGAAGHVTPDNIPEPAGPGRAKHGPRDYRTPPRAMSMPPRPEDNMGFHHSQMHSLYGNQPPAHLQSQADLTHQTPPTNALYDEPGQYPPESQAYPDDPYQQPDFLPQLPPSNRQRAATGQQRYAPLPPAVQPAPLQPRPQSHTGLPHSHSAPIVPSQHETQQVYNDSYNQLNTDYPEPIPDVEYQHRRLRQQQPPQPRRERRADVPPGWQAEYGGSDPFTQAPIPLDDGEDDGAPPPPPPMHSHSAPAVPHVSPSPSSTRYGVTPPRPEPPSVPSASPLQRLERGYAQQQHTPPHNHPQRGRSVDEYAATPPEHSPYGHTPPAAGMIPGQPSTSPYSRISPAARALPAHQRHSVAGDPYYGTTPPRPHPLSKEVPRSRSPLPDVTAPPQGYAHDYRQREAAPMIKPRAVSPQPVTPGSHDARRPRSAYSIQHPVRAHESSDGSPLSTSMTRLPAETPMKRTPVSARPSPGAEMESPGGVPFSPDSFDIHNPNARPSPLATSPHTPFKVQTGPEAERPERRGPIVGWHGQEIDPSDHLPVDSWAPEPEKKTPTKTYGLGRDRDFGPRTAVSGGIVTSGGKVSKDTVVHVRRKTEPAPGPVPIPAPASAGRNRLVKKNGPGGRSPGGIEPLGEHHNFNSAVPNPYAQPQEYSHHGGFGASDRSPGGYSAGYSPGGSMGCSPSGGYGSGPPHVPPKVPLGMDQEDQANEALAREISSIDIGAGRYSRPASGNPYSQGQQVPAPTAYVPVKSHRERAQGRGGSWY